MGDLLPFGRGTKHLVIADEWPGFSLSLSPVENETKRNLVVVYPSYSDARDNARRLVRDYPQILIGVIDQTGLDKRFTAREKFLPILAAAKELEGFQRILDRCPTRSDQKALIMAAHGHGAITDDECSALITARMLEVD